MSFTTTLLVKELRNIEYCVILNNTFIDFNVISAIEEIMLLKHMHSLNLTLININLI